MAFNEILVNQFTESQVKNNIQSFRTGDTVKVHLKITEGSKERIQIFEGFVLKRSKKVGSDATFTIRKESYGIGVEKTFFLNSPTIIKIEVVKLGKVRQAKIFYMRERKGKSARIKPRQPKVINTTNTKKDVTDSNKKTDSKTLKQNVIKTKESFEEKKTI